MTGVRVIRGPVVVGHVLGWPGDVIETTPADAARLLAERPGMVELVARPVVAQDDSALLANSKRSKRR